MAAGEMIQLTTRVYLDADKTHIVEQGPNAAWFLGGEGHLMPRDDAEALGLVMGEHFGPVQNGMTAIIEQERRNRYNAATSSAVMIQPPAISTATVPDRMAYHRETGEPFDGHPDQAVTMTGSEDVPESKQSPAPENKQIAPTETKATPAAEPATPAPDPKTVEKK